MPEPTPSGSPDEELLRGLEEELRKLKVADVLGQTMLTVSQLGWRKLGTEDRDLDEARLAIDALRALLGALAGSLPTEAVRDFNRMVANMQLAYATAVAEVGHAGAPVEPEAPST